jgi:hypothetical protein
MPPPLPEAVARWDKAQDGAVQSSVCVVPGSLSATKDKPCRSSRMLHRPVPAALARRFAQSPKDSRSTGILVALTYLLADGPGEVMK